MVEATKFMFDNNMFEVWDTVPLTINQLDKYVEFVNAKGTSVYQGMNEHDDFVAALMVGAFTLYEDFGFKY
jgi:phage-related protein